MVDRLTELVNNIDIYIIPDQQPSFRKKYRLFFPWKNSYNNNRFIKNIRLIVRASVIGIIFFQCRLREANIIMIYIFGVLISSIVTRGHLCGVISSLLSVIVFNYFFTEPRYTLQCRSGLSNYFFHYAVDQCSFQYTCHKGTKAGKTSITKSVLYGNFNEQYTKTDRRGIMMKKYWISVQNNWKPF